ncbi:Ras-related GTP-binding protein A OS=Mus musculus GN=Rraga PE=2 SV=1 [Rhizoctonia solani AG-1 IB]|uniref:GTP-binding protein n=2 Tax=Rhizoctonia solani TaxID=456999 RepID=A0A0B7FNY3_THACB|nr:Ras-related GTP-binding protein A OS=Mus musculus GN=Rraga PE=2 SV=1 [Rhizoctonia solani AG-1 IB]
MSVMAANKKKVLLMGKSGSGKTSMRSVIFSNNTASATSRLGATIDVEQNHMRFLGDLMLNLWDCGGQDNFFDSYLSSQRQTIFNDVAVLIYVFDIEIETRQPTEAVLKEKEKDFEYFYHILDNCRSRSPEAKIFVLINKMDLISGGKKEKDEAYTRKVRELETRAKPVMGDTSLRCFGTSIWDQSLYRAWSRIVHTLIPNANLLARHLSMFCTICDATEVVLFERTTFLIIARSGRSGEFGEQGGEVSDSGDDPINPERFEKISELIKAFKLSCSKLQEQFSSLEMRFPQFACLLDVLTPNTYVMVVTSHPNIQPSLLRLNVRLARSKFNELQAGRFPSVPTTPISPA